jgi:putative membrane protein
MAEEVAMSWYHHDLSWWGYVGTGIGMAVFSALVIVGMVLLIRLLGTDRQTPSPPPPSAEQLLAARFARGEITEDEYRECLSALRDPTRD